MQFKNLQLILIIFFSAVLFLGCSKKEKLHISSKQDDFTVHLAANPTTGFQWSLLRYDEKLFELINRHYISSKVGVMGAGGEMLYTFKLKKQAKYPRKSVLEFKYARSWEPDTATKHQVTVYID